jgi:adenylyltransferase/sulfurtransferase
MKENNRYIRQLILPGFGVSAQEKLRSAKVLVVGAGGLGCPVLQYLAAAGVGHLGIMDEDLVSLSNLHRQLLFAEADVAKKKVAVAAEKLKKIDAEISINTYPFSLTNQNALSIIALYDLVIDATDNFPAKYIINDACVILNKPFVYGAVSRYEGQVTVFNLVFENEERAIHYRDLFPVPPMPSEVQTCEETGVLGPLPGIIGNIQAAEAIKIITGLGNTLYKRLYNYDLLEAKCYEISLNKRNDITTINKESFEQMNYDFSCVDDDIPEINVTEFHKLAAQSNVFVLDVREKHERPVIDFSDAQIPMSELQTAIDDLPEKEICVICHQGIRSVYAAQLIKSKRNLNVYSLKGGLTAYFSQ